MYGKRILMLSPFAHWPLSQGSIVRSHHWARYLANHNALYFAVRPSTVTDPILPVQQLIFAPHGRLRQLFSLRFLRQLRQLVTDEVIDFILVSHLWSGLQGVLLKWLCQRPLFFDNHNVEYLRLRRMGNRAWPFVALLEAFVCHAADQISAVSDTDRALLIKKFRLPAAKVQTAVNGADIARTTNQTVDTAAVRQTLGIAPDDHLLLFFGPLDHPPNAQAVDLILAHIVPRLDQTAIPWRLLIVGAGQADYLQKKGTAVPHPRLLFGGYSDDIVATIKSANVVIVPLQAGSGTRYKIIESVACQRRVISTSIGAEGLALAAFGASLTICDEWSAFVAQIVASYGQPQQLPPPPLFAQTYDWQAILAGIDWQKVTAVDE